MPASERSGGPQAEGERREAETESARSERGDAWDWMRDACALEGVGRRTDGGASSEAATSRHLHRLVLLSKRE